MRIDPIKKITGERIRKRRIALDISQEDLGKMVDLSRASIANIERGAQAVDISQLFVFARKLDTTPDQLMPEFKADPLDKLSSNERFLVEDVIKEAARRYG